MRTIQLAREQANATIADEIDRYVDLYYPAYQDGHLLVKGAIADQPARYLEIIGEMREMDARVEAKAAEILKPEE